MKKKLILPFLALSCMLMPLKAQNPSIQFLSSDYDDPSIFEKGQTAPHAFHLPYNSKDNFQSLNGSWKFIWAERPDLIPEGFEAPGFDTDEWDEIPVPSNWQMYGYGHPKFRNIPLSFESDPPHIPDYYNPTGCYKRNFQVPQEWIQKEVFLRFEGIKSASYVWINGEKAGYNQGGFEPAEYNITPFINEGENDISVQVIRFSDGSYLENQDMWRLSGIYRDVKLFALPKVHIHDFYYTTDLDENYRDAMLSTKISLANPEKISAQGYSISVDVLDKQGLSVLDEKLSEAFTLSGEGRQEVELQCLVKNPLLWSAEHPSLHTILFELKDGLGLTLEAFSETLGFREVDMMGEVIRVNGAAVKLNGVNSHMHHPLYGQAVPLETLRLDLLMMKRYNINCVRTCHYPPTSEYLDMCDELGIYVIDEVGDEAHENIQLSYDSTYTEMYRDRTRKLLHRDRNHASILMWSAGNESGSGPNIHEVINTGLAIDPSRPTWMYGGNTFYIPFEPITGPRYWTPVQLKNLALKKHLGPDDLRPSFMDEYLAATGNGLGGMDEYWDLIWRYPRLSGGAIWDWISPGIETILWTTPDASGQKNHGAIMGRPIFEQGHEGRGLTFSGHDDWVEFYRDPGLDITGDKLTISFWIKPELIPQVNTIITKGKYGYGIQMDTPGSLEFYLQLHNPADVVSLPYMEGETGRKSARTEVPKNWYGQWHHVAGIYDGTSARLYIDQELYAETQCTGLIRDTPYPLCIGREAESQDQGEFSGRMSSMTIDNVRIYPLALPVEKTLGEYSANKAILALDFEEDSKGETFYSTGLGGRTYGIIWPNREVQPEIHQVKKSGQPIASEIIDPEKGRLRIINRHHFKNLDEFTTRWELMLDGLVVEEGELALALEAQSQTELNIPYTLPKEQGEIILTLSYSLKNETLWALAGHEVAFEQFFLREAQNAASAKQKNKAPKGKISLTESREQVTISGSDFTYIISKEDGSFEQLEFKKTSLLEKGPLFNIWRAPLANDVDPWGAHTYAGRYMTPGLGRSIDNQLRTLGMRDLDVGIEKVEVRKTGNSTVELMLHKFWNSTNLEGAFECIEKYIFLADGSIQIDLQIIPHGHMPDILPRAGWQLELPKSFADLEWYGRGIFETYPDRKTGAKMGIYQSSIDQEYVPYILPQDYGNHCDVRWLKLSDKQGHGLQLSSGQGMNFSYQKYSTDMLSRAVYTYQLKEADVNTLNIDFEVSGVGGTAIRQLEKYRVKPAVINFQFSIKPF